MSETIGFVVAALIGSLTGLLTLFIGRQKLKAEVSKLEADEAEQLTKTAISLIPPLQERITELEKIASVQIDTLAELGKKLEQSNRLIRTLLRGMAILIHQLQQLDVTPLFVIPVVNGQDTIEELEKRLIDEVNNSERR